MSKKLFFYVAIAVCLSSVPSVQAEDEAPEVQAAREAATKHNEAVRRADAELERAIERAKREHRQQRIKAKERLVDDLRRALRRALKSDTPENAVLIKEQIALLQGQVDDLKKRDRQAEAEVKEGKSKKLHKFYVGTWNIKFPDRQTRKYVIEADGSFTPIEDSLSSLGGYIAGLGITHKAVMKGDYLMLHDRGWTHAGRENGRVIFIKINPNGWSILNTRTTV